jgi:hypothetical protein
MRAQTVFMAAEHISMHATSPRRLLPKPRFFETLAQKGEA